MLGVESSDDKSEGFGTLLPRPWNEFNTPITNTGRRRRQDYVIERLKGGVITPTVIRVQEKVAKASDIMVLAGQLSTEYLRATQAREKARKKRNNISNKVIQKFGEIYGYQARRQITDDKKDKRKVVNIREERVKKKKEKERVKVKKAAAKALKAQN